MIKIGILGGQIQTKSDGGAVNNRRENAYTWRIKTQVEAAALVEHCRGDCRTCPHRTECLLLYDRIMTSGRSPADQRSMRDNLTRLKLLIGQS